MNNIFRSLSVNIKHLKQHNAIIYLIITITIATANGLYSSTVSDYHEKYCTSTKENQENTLISKFLCPEANKNAHQDLRASPKIIGDLDKNHAGQQHKPYNADLTVPGNTIKENRYKTNCLPSITIQGSGDEFRYLIENEISKYVDKHTIQTSNISVTISRIYLNEQKSDKYIPYGTKKYNAELVIIIKDANTCGIVNKYYGEGESSAQFSDYINNTAMTEEALKFAIRNAVKGEK